MKKNFISVALFVVLATMAVSCQKENLVEPQSTTAEVGTVRTVLYAVDGVEHVVTLYGDDAWNVFVNNMLVLSEQGHDIRFINESAKTSVLPTKETQTLTTTSQSEANAWMREKGDEGYTVTLKHENGQYTCVAVR
jgi:hypothetical protein